MSSQKSKPMTPEYDEAVKELCRTGVVRLPYNQWKTLGEVVLSLREGKEQLLVYLENGQMILSLQTKP